jgi:diadenosine tetraphosphate (Ap4A) HIT family hydrolase
MAVLSHSRTDAIDYYEDDLAIAFLDKYPRVAGYTLLAPRAHRQNVTADFAPAEYLELQRRLHRVAEAVRLETAAERIYLLSLGSHQGNAHVHWHIVPLPRGFRSISGPFRTVSIGRRHPRRRVALQSLRNAFSTATRTPTAHFPAARPAHPSPKLHTPFRPRRPAPRRPCCRRGP